MNPQRTKRQIHEPGHQRKFLVVADESPECESALFFAACRARNTGSFLTVLYVVEPGEFQHWISVEALQREEGEAKAKAVFRLYQRKLAQNELDKVPRDEIIRFGEITEELISLINEDPDIGFLVLGASTSPQGPGKLVSWLGETAAGGFPTPFVVVPGSLTLEEIEALS